ncbi:Ribosomal RNA small subunit methyltransferase H [Commensalibacter sp. Nvir]|uniref:16S rRNA (cytosine(1402)-N(4))-methyltransferase RsmH n=1 Tax=Commensalibacter sp. Nvir TaxID=3069817 RepID=UPI002D46409B|nr:Ribosomal RNA small subunit methyltransferase H [Commensalibacter sp. Nvir]
MNDAYHSQTVTNGHYPVMLKEMMALLQPQPKKLYIDATFGGGGYSKEILSATSCKVIGIDRDPDAILRGMELQKTFPNLDLIQGEFGNIDKLLQAHHIKHCDGIILDLGVSSYQIDQAERGFSFRFQGPLDMRMSKEGKTAYDLVNFLSEEELADILWYYGEERFSRRIAKNIVKERAKAPIQTTQDLVTLIKKTIPTEKSGINPATRSFQALRIAVNNELEQIHSVMKKSLSLLNPGGKLLVVSFHSLEDRIVKEVMNRAIGNIAKPSRHQLIRLPKHDNCFDFTLLTHKPLRPSQPECLINSRSRSARLRAIKRNDQPKERNYSL